MNSQAVCERCNGAKPNEHRNACMHKWISTRGVADIDTMQKGRSRVACAQGTSAMQGKVQHDPDVIVHPFKSVRAFSDTSSRRLNCFIWACIHAYRCYTDVIPVLVP